MSRPAIPLSTILDAQRALQMFHQHTGPISIEQRLMAANTAGELRYWTEKLLADQQAPVRVPALSLVPSAPTPEAA